jgi:hypothetical protein
MFAGARGRVGIGHFNSGRLPLGFHRVGLGFVVLMNRQQPARRFLIGSDQGEAKTDVGLAVPGTQQSACKTTHCPSNA